MRKEAFVAIIIGVSVGLLIAFGILRANTALKSKNLISTEFMPTKKVEKPRPEGVKELSINLVTPENLSVSVTEEVTYSGITKPGVVLVISTESKDYILKAPANGSFEQSTTLIGGLNQTLISAFDETKNEVKEKGIVIYSKEFTDTTKEDVSETENLKDRINSAKSKPHVFMGTITDKTDNSLQIKNFEGTIQIVAITKNASFAQDLTTPKVLKYTDIAIGDYIIAMGFENTKGVLTTERVVVSKPFSEPTRKILFGKILSINKKVVTIEDKNSIAWVLTLPTKWEGPDLKDLVVGQNLIAVGEPERDKPENIKVRTMSLEPVTKNTPTLSPTPTLKVSPTTKPKASPTPKI